MNILRITAVLNATDPMGLLSAGAPPDEYSLEADLMLKEWEKNGEITRGYLERMFTEMFYEGALKPEKAQEMANLLKN